MLISVCASCTVVPMGNCQAHVAGRYMPVFALPKVVVAPTIPGSLYHIVQICDQRAVYCSMQSTSHLYPRGPFGRVGTCALRENGLHAQCRVQFSILNAACTSAHNSVEMVVTSIVEHNTNTGAGIWKTQERAKLLLHAPAVSISPEHHRGTSMCVCFFTSQVARGVGRGSPF